VHFAGVLSETDRRLAVRCPVSVVHGYLSHAESIALMRSADLLFLPMQNLPPGRRSSTVPGKTYEYLASGRPILAAVPDGDARDILESWPSALICRPDDTDAIASAIAAALAGETDERVGGGRAQRFSYRHLAGEVAAVLDEAILRSSPARAVSERRPRAASRDRELDVLMLAYHFPPIGGAGAQWSLKFARYLPENGCSVTVVTGPGTTTGRWTPNDETSR